MAKHCGMTEIVAFLVQRSNRAVSYRLIYNDVELRPRHGVATHSTITFIPRRIFLAEQKFGRISNLHDLFVAGDY